MPKIVKRNQLQKRINRKALTQAFVGNLIGYFGTKSQAPSICANQYNNAHWCASYLTKENDKLRTHYCKTRLCYICNAIRMAMLINGYGPQLEPLIKVNRLYFVTLTQPTCCWTETKVRLDDMSSWWGLIRNLRNKLNLRIFKGIRKVESTINYPKGHVHLHYHLLVEGERNASWIQDRWLKSHPLAIKKAQSVLLVKKGEQWRTNPLTGEREQVDVLVEMFKYMNKMVYKDEQGRPTLVPRGLKSAQIFNEIFCAFKGRRLVQPFGGLRKVSEEIADAPLIAEEVKSLVGNNWGWERKVPNYVSEWGELLADGKLDKSVESYLQQAPEVPTHNVLLPVEREWRNGKKITSL